MNLADQHCAFDKDEGKTARCMRTETSVKLLPSVYLACCQHADVSLRCSRPWGIDTQARGTDITMTTMTMSFPHAVLEEPTRLRSGVHGDRFTQGAMTPGPVIDMHS